MSNAASRLPRLRVRPLPGEARSFERIQAHYLVERELADRLRHASREVRGTLYTQVYDELYRRVPDHPQLTSKADTRRRAAAVDEQLQALRRFLRRDTTFLEVGAGDCALSLAVAPAVSRTIAVDVSDQVAVNLPKIPNFEFLISDGQSVPVPRASISVAYSFQLMEHLHPDDARGQLLSIHEALAPGGVYVIVTPSRITGPHDISLYFDAVATGFHLREYTYGELQMLLLEAGFTRIVAIVGLRGRFAMSPVWPLTWLEWWLLRLPEALRRRVAQLPFVRTVLAIRLAAYR